MDIVLTCILNTVHLVPPSQHCCLQNSGAIFPQDILTEWGEAGPKLFLRMFQKRLTALQAQPDNIHRNQAGVPYS